MASEFWGAIAPYVNVVRSNQATEEEKRRAVLACYALAHADFPEDLPDLWELLTTLYQATGDPNGQHR